MGLHWMKGGVARTRFWCTGNHVSRDSAPRT